MSILLAYLMLVHYMNIHHVMVINIEEVITHLLLLLSMVLYGDWEHSVAIFIYANGFTKVCDGINYNSYWKKMMIMKAYNRILTDDAS